MFDTWHDKEFLYGIIDAIHENAAVREHDEYILYVAIASIFASLVVAGAAFWLNYRQVEIAREQKNISDMQAKIMEQQNKIALFSERYELFKMLELIENNVKQISNYYFVNDYRLRNGFLLYLLFFKILPPNFEHKAFEWEATYQGLVKIVEKSQHILVYLQKVVFLFLLTEAELKKYNEILKSLEIIIGYFYTLSLLFAEDPEQSHEEILAENLPTLKKISELNITLKKQLDLVNQQSTQESKPCKTTE